jgi:hypothetical protein
MLLETTVSATATSGAIVLDRYQLCGPSFER